MIRRRTLKPFSSYAESLTFGALHKVKNLKLIDNILDGVPLPQSIVSISNGIITPITNVEILSIFHMLWTKHHILIDDNIYLNLDQDVSVDKKSGQIIHNKPWMIRTKNATNKMVHINDMFNSRAMYKYSSVFPFEYDEIYCNITTNLMDSLMTIIEITKDDWRLPALLKQCSNY